VAVAVTQGGPPMKCCNYQEIKIQEQVQRLAVGTIPRSMWIVLMDDLVDTCKPGDDLTVWYVHHVLNQTTSDHFVIC